MLSHPSPSSVEPQTGILRATRWVDVAGRALRRTWMTRLPQPIRRGASACGNSEERFPSNAPTTCHTFASPLELAGSARTQWLVGTTADANHCCWCSPFFALERGGSQTGKQRGCLMCVTQVMNNLEHVLSCWLFTEKRGDHGRVQLLSTTSPYPRSQSPRKNGNTVFMKGSCRLLERGTCPPLGTIQRYE